MLTYIGRAGAALVLTVIIPIVLAYLYLALPLPVWLAAAVVHSALAVLLFIFCYRHIFPNRATGFGCYLPALLILFLCFLAISLSSFYGVPVKGKVPDRQYLLVLWIPVVEEIVFRLGIGRWLRYTGGNFLGIYCSATCFALVHALPTWERIISGKVGIFIGAFFLGLICEYLYMRNKNLLPSIAFHVACNCTVPIFIYFDQRWLDWLHMLYQQ